MPLRKKWTKDEIEKIYNLKKTGLTFKAIGTHFGVNGNTIRKALQRHSPLFIPRSKKNYNISLKNVTYDIAIQWAKSNNYDIKEDSKVSAIFNINTLRYKKNLPIFLIRDKYCL